MCKEKHLSWLALGKFSLLFQAVYVNDDVRGLPASLILDWSAFTQDPDKESKLDWNEFHASGQVMNKNTLEGFKECDKKALLNSESTKLWAKITSGEAIKNPSVLSKFIVLMFADLKKYNFYYWFAFPALTLPGLTGKNSPNLNVKKLIFFSLLPR